MILSSDNSLQDRVLVLAPTERDSGVTRGLLQQAKISCCIVSDVAALTREIHLGAGAALVTDDIFNSSDIHHLLAAIARQPDWSDFPTVMLVRGGSNTDLTSEALTSLRNVTLLERPAPMRSLVSAVQSAVRSRQRQYQIRDQIEQIQSNQRERESLLESERAARTDAERANRVKDEFLATVSHELRTPLNAILGWSQILLRMPDDPTEVSTGMEVIERNARVQAKLIDDLLDMSRILSGKIRLDAQVINPAALLEAAAASAQPAADAKNIRLIKKIQGPYAVLGDAGRIQQILWNLLSNAVKFTPNGGTVTISLQGENGHAEISIADTGKGIAPEFLPHVFERFRQADSSTTRTFGGLGLGLAIVKQLVELHGGAVRVHSLGEGAGATFTVSLPLTNAQPANSKKPAPCDNTDLSNVRILLVDDDADARRLIKRLLGDCKADVTLAASAPEALACLSHLHPDLLISDIGMPEMDGYQFIHKVRDLHPAATLPAIALTAFARPEDRRRALLSGFQTHITKPVNPTELLSNVATLVNRTPLPN